MVSKENAKANVITAKNAEEQKIREQVEEFCERAISSTIERASKNGYYFAWVQVPAMIIAKKKTVNEYLRVVGGFSEEDIQWQGHNLRIAWGE